MRKYIHDSNEKVCRCQDMTIMLNKENGKMNHDTVYVAYKEPMEQHPQIGRVGICNGTPILEDGWSLYSYMTGENAEDIYSSVMKEIHEINASHKNIPEEESRLLGMLPFYDAENDFCRILIKFLDGLMISAEHLLHIGDNTKTEMQYFPVCEEVKERVALENRINQIVADSKTRFRKVVLV